MDYVLLGHDCEHAVQTVIQVFYPNEGYKRLAGVPLNGQVVVSQLLEDELLAYVYNDGELVAKGRAKQATASKKDLTQSIAGAIYDALTSLTGYFPPWGTLTGVRPAKIVTEQILKGYTYDHAAEYLHRAYRVSNDKIKLCLEVAKAEESFCVSLNPDDIGIYIGIPFCPTRCRYCSFTSYPLPRYGALREAYLFALFKELDYVGRITANKNVRAVYVGGGTPTALEPYMLEQLMARISCYFENTPEFTVEAGRPDSITVEKLAILKKYNVTRLAVNPQTMSDETLLRIGRNHTADEFSKAYALAAELFDNINCDVIMGLPGEGRDEAEHTFDILKQLAPKSITVHTLAVKRAAELSHIIGRYGEGGRHDETVVADMLRLSHDACCCMGLSPYYMYRQKNMIGNFENVGYAVPGYECVYNLQTMTESVNVYAIGAGAVSKVLFPEINLIKRAFNVKNLDEYIERIDEMIERKRNLLEIKSQ